jgi:hypothetical protein
MFRVEGAHSHTYHGCVPENSGLIVRDATGVFFCVHAFFNYPLKLFV